LAHTIAEGEAALEADAIPHQGKAKFREALRKKKERLAEIDASIPNLQGADKDAIAKIREETTKILKQEHPRFKDQEKGITDAHEEVKKMTDKYIPLKDEKMANFAKECNVEIKDGKISRNDMDKIHKLASKMLGESTDIEALRRD
jgi:hypothetical protein